MATRVQAGHPANRPQDLPRTAVLQWQRKAGTVTLERDVRNDATMLMNREPRVIALPAGPPSSIAARTFTQSILEQWQLADLSDDVRLVVAELVTNAVRHASGPVSLTLQFRGQGVHVEVTDDSSAMPSAKSLGDTGTSGRGLAIVAAISRDWGARELSTGGKSVWADVNRTAS
jgi:signal transduction histidine kinase